MLNCTRAAHTSAAALGFLSSPGGAPSQSARAHSTRGQRRGAEPLSTSGDAQVKALAASSARSEKRKEKGREGPLGSVGPRVRPELHKEALRSNHEDVGTACLFDKKK